MHLHIFNPSHDEALVINRPQYSPSSAARKMADKLWDVAKYWAAPDDFILRLPSDGSIRGVVVPDWNEVEEIHPWGWDRHIVGLLRRLGAPDRLLPSEAQLDKIRELSSRKTTVMVLEKIRENLQLIPFNNIIGVSCSFQNILSAESRWCTTEEEVLLAVQSYGGTAMFKAPWSCSGRGVWTASLVSVAGADSPQFALDEKSLLRLRKCLREQGGVEVEPHYARLADFAMEFWSDGRGSVTYEGLSFFETGAGGAYFGNVLAPQSELERQLLAKGSATPDDLEAVRQLLLPILAEIIGQQYRGPFGVDMMLTPEGVHPCIEVNLRNTMGRVAIFQQKAQ